MTIRMILAVSADICACPRIVASGIYATSSPPTQALSMVKEDQLSPAARKWTWSFSGMRSLFCLVEAVSEPILDVVAVSLTGGG